MSFPGASRMVRAWRLLRFALHVLQGVATVGLVFPFIPRAHRVWLIRRWAAGILNIFNVAVSITGHAPQAGLEKAVFVANHISWLDPALIMARFPAHFVAKSEIRSWPVLGWLSEKAGTLFIERGKRHDTTRIIRSLSEALKDGDSIGLFPEGTTSDGTRLQPFHSSLLQAALLAQAVMYPVAIRYRRSDGSVDTALAYTGDISFVDSLKLVLAQPEIRAELAFAAPIPAAGRTRRELAHEAERVIADALNLPPPCREPGIPGGLPGAVP